MLDHELHHRRRRLHRHLRRHERLEQEHRVIPQLVARRRGGSDTASRRRVKIVEQRLRILVLKLFGLDARVARANAFAVLLIVVVALQVVKVNHLGRGTSRRRRRTAIDHSPRHARSQSHRPEHWPSRHWCRITSCPWRRGRRLRSGLPRRPWRSRRCHAVETSSSKHLTQGRRTSQRPCIVTPLTLNEANVSPHGFHDTDSLLIVRQSPIAQSLTIRLR